MAETLKIGFIGAGGIARWQMEQLKKIPNVTIAAAADVDAAALAKAKDQYNIPLLFKDWREILKQKDITAVSVCTPNKYHFEPTVEALKAGKHVLVEKPMAMNALEADKMVKAAKKAKKVLQIAFQQRFSPEGQMLKKQMKDGKFGKILYVRCQALRRRGIPNWGVFGRKDLQGGGPLIDIGVHILELAHFVMGSPKPVTARGCCYTYLGNKKSDVRSAWENWDYKTYTVEDLAVGFLTFADGSSLTMESSFAAHIEEDVFTLQIMGTKGGATFSPLKVFTDQDGYMMNQTPSYVGKWDGFMVKMQHFVDCVRDGKKCEAPGEDGMAVQQMLDALYRSASTGKEITI